MAHVLVVDDDPDIRTLLDLALGLDGHDVTTAPDGDAGVAALRSACARGHQPVVLLDVQMPDRHGWDVLEAIRGDPLVRDIAVILCTVKAGAADLERGWTLGCDAYESKPFDIADINARVIELDALPIDERWRRRRERAATSGAELG